MIGIAGCRARQSRHSNADHADTYPAALADVPYCINNPLDAIQMNVGKTTQFLELLGGKDYPGRLILVSSESIYGHRPDVPVHENVAVPHPRTSTALQN
jgi:nucleoside-diphosphate-sugar epimerase